MVSLPWPAPPAAAVPAPRPHGACASVATRPTPDPALRCHACSVHDNVVAHVVRDEQEHATAVAPAAVAVRASVGVSPTDAGTGDLPAIDGGGPPGGGIVPARLIS